MNGCERVDVKWLLRMGNAEFRRKCLGKMGRLKGPTVVKAAIEMEPDQRPRVGARMALRPRVSHPAAVAGARIRLPGPPPIVDASPIRPTRLVRPQRLRSDLHPTRVRVSGRSNGSPPHHRLRSQRRLLVRLLTFPSPEQSDYRRRV